MLQPNTQDIREKLCTIFQSNFNEFILENMKKERDAFSFVWPHSSTWDNQRNVPRYPLSGLQSPSEQFIELSKYWDVCPYLLTYIHHLSICTLESAIALSRAAEKNDTKSGKVDKQDTPIIVEDSNAQMDIEISPLEANQSTSNMTLITKESSDETSFQPVLSKSQKKKQRRKAKVERIAAKANQSAKSSLNPSAKLFSPLTRNEQAGDEILLPPPEKKAKSEDQPNTRKVVENEALTVITGYQPAHNSQAFVRNIIVYNILAKWDNYTIINALSAWGKVISMTVKRQKKYKTLRVKLEISQFFKNYEKHWMALLMGFPDDLHRLINTPNVWNGETVDWTRHTSPSHNPRKAKPRSVKKVVTGTNNIPIRNGRGNASQQQYSSSTKQGKDSPKTEYDDKKHKSKSKRSSTSKKMIMAEIT
ncbi:hypothetical protein RclHR1_08340003 [Rhizophagus clarus]|uniref:Uncharacterized protein n=1 Tax=Rhizophagus clarus TaxID=94130 RepID=A0A2Z6SMX8_9GLOM|nr:hypothetical protein RclHR1_08340003 [Rhizophagus clarus]